MKTEQELQNEITQFISYVIDKATQALSPLFHQAVNTLLIEVLCLKQEPVSKIVNDFAVRVKTKTLQYLFQRKSQAGKVIGRNIRAIRWVFQLCPSKLHQISSRMCLCVSCVRVMTVYVLRMLPSFAYALHEIQLLLRTQTQRNNSNNRLPAGRYSLLIISTALRVLLLRASRFTH